MLGRGKVEARGDFRHGLIRCGKEAGRAADPAVREECHRRETDQPAEVRRNGAGGKVGFLHEPIHVVAFLRGAPYPADQLHKSAVLGAHAPGIRPRTAEKPQKKPQDGNPNPQRTILGRGISAQVVGVKGVLEGLANHVLDVKGRRGKFAQLVHKVDGLVFRKFQKGIAPGLRRADEQPVEERPLLVDAQTVYVVRIRNEDLPRQQGTGPPVAVELHAPLQAKGDLHAFRMTVEDRPLARPRGTLHAQNGNLGKTDRPQVHDTPTGSLARFARRTRNLDTRRAGHGRFQRFFRLQHRPHLNEGDC